MSIGIITKKGEKTVAENNKAFFKDALAILKEKNMRAAIIISVDSEKMDCSVLSHNEIDENTVLYLLKEALENYKENFLEKFLKDWQQKRNGE